MKTRDTTPSPQPVHVHVPETTLVHVHMKRSPTKTLKLKRSKDTQVKAEGATSKVRSPWLPPGKLSTTGDIGSYAGQGNRGKPLERGRGRDGLEEEEPRVNLTLLLQEQEDNRRSRRSGYKDQSKDSDELLRALVEAEIDGVAVANQLTTLRETIIGLAKDKRLSKFHAASVGRQQGLLFDKIDIFDHTNQKLREMLREWSQSERDSIMLYEEKDALQKRLSKSETEKTELQAKLGNKEKELSKLTQDLGFEQECMRTTQGLSKVLESTRDDLEIQLNKAEADKIRMGALIQRMQQKQEQQQQMLQALQDDLQAGRQDNQEAERAKRDQEALKMLTQRAEVAEMSIRELSAILQEKETKLAQALSTSSTWCQRHTQEASNKEQLEREVSQLKLQVSDLQSQLQSAGERRRAEKDQLQDQLHQLNNDITAVKLENKRLQAEMMSTEEKFKGLYTDARQLKTSLKKNENLVDKYKKKVQRAREESEDSRLKMESTQREMQEARVHLEHEKEIQRRELLAQLQELEILPERLRRTEQELREAQQESDAHELRHIEHSSALSEVRHKVEQQGAQLEMFQQRNQLLQDENNVLKEKIHNLEMRLEDMKLDNSEMCHALNSKEMGLHCVQQQLDDKSHECNLLSKQLQQTLNDSQRQVGDGIHNVIVKERSSQSKALDLESQLSRAKTDLSQLQRSKEEMERRYHSQLLNLKDRLEHSDFTNQTLHNYVHFLKHSYGNTFADSLQTNWRQNSSLNS